MTERARVAAILRTFADEVEKSEKLDKYKKLELAAIYVWGFDAKGIQVPAIIRQTDKDMPNLGMKMSKEGIEENDQA